jgi:predicted transcriptional regulator
MKRPTSQPKATIRAHILAHPDLSAQQLADRLGITAAQVAGYRAGATRAQRSAHTPRPITVETVKQLRASIRRLDRVRRLLERLIAQALAPGVTPYTLSRPHSEPGPGRRGA